MTRSQAPALAGHASDAGALAFELPGGGRALFTARRDGNMSSVGGDDAEHGHRARERLRARIGLACLARGYQVHGTVVARVRTMPARECPQRAAEQCPHADGQATALAGVGTIVLAADCLPVALGCSGAVAMVHAGWRGLSAGVLEQGVAALRELSDAAGDGRVVAIVGPGAGVCCYEVGAEVHDALGGAHARGPAGRPIGDRPAAASPIDLRAIARERLLAAGVAQVRDVDVCTICDRRFFSHRREGARAGRQAGVAWLSS
jgi:polyphenol oxidase